MKRTFKSLMTLKIAVLTFVSFVSCEGKEVNISTNEESDIIYLEVEKAIISGEEYTSINGLPFNLSLQYQIMEDNSYSCSNSMIEGEKLSVTWSGENIIIQDESETIELVQQDGYYLWNSGDGTVFYYHEVDALSTDENYYRYATIFSLSSYGGKWEAANLANDATELEETLLLHLINGSFLRMVHVYSI